MWELIPAAFESEFWSNSRDILPHEKMQLASVLAIQIKLALQLGGFPIVEIWANNNGILLFLSIGRHGLKSIVFLTHFGQFVGTEKFALRYHTGI